MDTTDARADLAAAEATDAAFENVNLSGASAGHDDSGYDDAGYDDAGYGSDPEPTCRVLVYSSNHGTRQQVMSALGRRPAEDLPALEYVEVATQPRAIELVDAGGLDLLILDGEAAPAGGMGLCRQLKDEIYHCPPVLVLVGRPQDAWLATWSRADGVTSHPLDAVAAANVVTSLLRSRLAVATT